jgi:hypothetical protein
MEEDKYIFYINLYNTRRHCRRHITKHRFKHLEHFENLLDVESELTSQNSLLVECLPPIVSFDINLYLTPSTLLFVFVLFFDRYSIIAKYQIGPDFSHLPVSMTVL